MTGTSHRGRAGVQAHWKEASVLPLDSSSPLASMLFFGGFFYSKVYLLDSWVNTTLGGKVGSQCYSMCQP